jgi:hypothetical protein
VAGIFLQASNNSLAVMNRDGALVPIDVGPFETEEFATPDACGGGETERRPVNWPELAFVQRFDLLDPQLADFDLAEDREDVKVDFCRECNDQRSVTRRLTIVQDDRKERARTSANRNRYS